MAGSLRHWKERNGRYSARIVIPPYLRPYLENRAELEIQLGGDKRTALRNHAAAVASIQRQIGIARQKHEVATGQQPTVIPYPLSPQQIALREYREQIDLDAAIRQQDHRYAQLDPDPDDARMFRDGFSGRLSDDQLDQLVGHRIRNAQIAGNTDAKKGTPQWRTLAQYLCVAIYESMERDCERNGGDFNGKPSHPILVAALEANAAENSEPAPITFDTIINEEVKRRSRGKDAKPLPALTIKKYRDHCSAFAKWRKSDDALTTTAAEGKSWIESLQDAGELSNRTVKAMLQNVRTVMNWGRQNDPATFFPTGNPLNGIKAPDYTTAPSYLKAYTMDEAKLILTAARKEDKAMFRWIPWLCAYSGMRVSEAGNLRKEDFFQIEGRWFWKVTTVGGRSLKTAGSERRIPVHEALFKEGLIEFVMAAKPGRLFKGDTKDAVLIQPRISTWVRSFIAFDKRPELSPNHGWRHLFEDFCRRDHVPDDARYYITGRTEGGSRDMYGRSDVMLPGLVAAMDKINPIKLK